MAEPYYVLLVDDEESFWRPMSLRLMEKGFRVEVATSGPQAVALAREAQCGHDVAVIDQVMGPPNGLETMQHLQRLCPEIQTIILTGWELQPGEAAIELGALSYVSKPVSADQLGLHIQAAARLRRERRQKMAQQALVTAGQRISGAHCLEDLYQGLWKETSTLLPGLSAFLVSRYDQDGACVSFPFGSIQGEPVQLPNREHGNGLSEWVLRSGQPLLLPYGDRDFREENGLAPPDSRLGHSTSEIVVPIFLEGRLIGTINALSYEPDVHYSQELLEVLQAFANQAAGAIRAVEQLEEAEQLLKAVAAVASQHAEDKAWESVVDQFHELTGSHFTGLILHGADGRLNKRQPAMPREFYDKFEAPRQVDGVSRWVVENRAPRVIPETSADPLVKDSVRAAGIRSMLALPLIQGDQVLGVLYAHYFEQRYFSRHHVDLWRTFAFQASGVLQSMLEKESEVEDARRLAEVMGALAERLGLEDVTRAVAEGAKGLFRADACAAVCLDLPTGRILVRSLAGQDPEGLQVEGEMADELTRYVLGTKRPVFCSGDAEGEGPRLSPGLVAQGVQTVAALPLLHAGRVIAVLHCLYQARRQPFDERTRMLFEAFSARAAQALARARHEQLNDAWHALDRQTVLCTNVEEVHRLFAEAAQAVSRADFVVFYPYDPTAPQGQPRFASEPVVVVGDLLEPWRTPQGGWGSSVRREIEQAADAVLIVGDLQRDSRFMSHLAEREKIQAFVGLRLDALPADPNRRQIAGILFLNFRQPAAFEPGDLGELRRAGSLVAATILRFKLLEQRNKQMHQVVEILKAFCEEPGGEFLLQRIARAGTEAWGIDACTLLEYDEQKAECTARGASGLDHPTDSFTLPPEFKARFLDADQPVWIRDAGKNELLQKGKFVEREGIQSALVCPMRMESEKLGLLFANYRRARELTQDEMTAIAFLADLAALVLYQARLRSELSQTRERLDRRLFLFWASMVDATWRHTVVTQAAAILNYAHILKKPLDSAQALPPAMKGIPETVREVESLAREIATSRPQPPQSWELEASLVPLGALLIEVAERMRGRIQRGDGAVEVRVEPDAFGAAQVWGRRRWLIYALEELLHNARKAMPQGGSVLISGQVDGGWATVRIRDSGRGVPAELQGRLYGQPIPREAGRLETGLGSLLVKAIVEDHLGTIELEKPGPGDTTVRIRLPIRMGVVQ